LRAVLEPARLGDDVPDLTDLPDELSLRTGDERSFLLPSRAGAGYVWDATVEDEAIVEASTQFEQADDAAVGHRTFSPNERLTLRGRSPGTTTVRIAQRRSWEEGVEPIGAHVLTVNVADEAEATERGGTQ
jgi:predicted secreted protein